MWQDHLRPCAVFTETSEEFAPYYLAGIRHDIRQTTVTSIVTNLVLPSDFFSGLLTLEPGRASVLLATSKDIVRVNVATGGVTIITDQVCSQSAFDVTGITVEASGDTALLAHRLCGILRVRVR